MSSVLRNLRKPELVDAAQASSLPNYAGYNVNELRTNLDEHLKANATTYASSSNEHLKAYYGKAGGAPKSPVKKIAEKVSDLVKSDDDSAVAPVVKKRRKTTTAPAEESTSTSLVKAAERRSSTFIQQAQESAATSPARMVALFDEKVAGPVQATYSKILQQSHVAEYTDAVRDWASSPLAISLLAIGFEAYGLRQHLVPFKHFADVPLTRGNKQPTFVPDLFVLLTKDFWAPFSLWLSTSAIIPLIASYFINIPLKAQPSHNYGTRRATSHASAENQLDPFVYFVAKALISYLVYAEHFLMLGSVSNFTVATVNENIYGKYESILITSAIGAAISLYAAILKK